jgi:hypothetical protein
MDAVPPRGSRSPDYTDEELIANWRACAQDLGHAPSALEYNAWRVAPTNDSDAGRHAAFSHTLERRVGGGSWSGIARAVGVPLPRSRRLRREFTRDELAGAWHACAADLGHPPSQPEYDRWREAHLSTDDTRHLPSSDTLMRRLGRHAWSRVAAALGVEVPRPAGSSRRFSDGELAEAWRACTLELGHPPSVEQYVGWRKNSLARDDTACLPHPKTLTERLGGRSWPGIAARLGVSYAPHCGPLSTAYGDDELTRAWECATVELGHPPTEAKYSEWRARRRAGTGADRLPHGHTLTNRLGHGKWPRVAAGVVCAPGPAAHRTYSVDQLAGAWRRCTVDLGHVPTQYDYDWWRAEQLAGGNAARVPHHKTLTSRLGRGSWPEIARRMRSEDECNVER